MTMGAGAAQGGAALFNTKVMAVMAASPLQVTVPTIHLIIVALNWTRSALVTILASMRSRWVSILSKHSRISTTDPPGPVTLVWMFIQPS